MKEFIFIILVTMLISNCVSFASEIETNPSDATVNITTLPDGATIFVNGIRLGTTPLKDIPLVPGHYNVSAKKDFYGDTNVTINLSAGGESNLILRLPPGKGEGSGWFNSKVFMVSAFILPGTLIALWLVALIF